MSSKSHFAIACFDQSDVKGYVLFQQKKQGSNVTFHLTSMKPYASHAIHIHEFGDQRKGCKSLGGHWNPYNKTHGNIVLDGNDRHAGDLISNLFTNGSGNFSYQYHDPLVVVNDVIGRSVVIHNGVDDLGRGRNSDSLTTGNAGSRKACAIIVMFTRLCTVLYVHEDDILKYINCNKPVLCIVSDAYYDDLIHNKSLVTKQENITIVAVSSDICYESHNSAALELNSLELNSLDLTSSEWNSYEKVYIMANKFSQPFSEQTVRHIHSIYTNDTTNYVFSKWLGHFVRINMDDNSVEQWRQRNNEELQYLNLLHRLQAKSVVTMDRTGTGIMTSFGEILRFDMSTGQIPLLTSKRTFFRGSVEEMLFFLSGSTDVNRLRQKGVYIWDGNTNRAFLDAHGLEHYEEYDMGPTYSFLFRHAGAESKYIGKHSNYDGQGINQFQEVIEGIKNNPYSRRHMINLWSPAHLSKMSLPPCLFNYIFHVDKKTSSVSLHVTMRSADVFLGVPFNLCGAALILRMVCHLTRRPPGELLLVMTNAHLYLNHVEQARTQLRNEPYLFPFLTINRFPEQIKDGDGFRAEDFVLHDYQCYPPIRAEMAV